MTDLAIRLRGVVKRYGPITAVDGLDVHAGRTDVGTVCDTDRRSPYGKGRR